MHATTGLVAIALQLRLLAKLDKCDCQEPDGVTVLSLGLRGQRYVLRDLAGSEAAIAYADKVIHLCRNANLACFQWPTDDAVESFADGLIALARAVRAPCAGPTLVGGGAAKRSKTDGTLEHEYLVKHFTRTFLLVGDRAGLFGTPASPSQAIDRLSVERLHNWLPDETGSMKHIHAQTAGWMREACGISVFIVSCFACFAHFLDATQRNRILAATDDALWPAVHKWMRWRAENPEAIDCWPPTFKSLIVDI